MKTNIYLIHNVTIKNIHNTLNRIRFIIMGLNFMKESVMARLRYCQPQRSLSLWFVFVRFLQGIPIVIWDHIKPQAYDILRQSSI